VLVNIHQVRHENHPPNDCGNRPTGLLDSCEPSRTPPICLTASYESGYPSRYHGNSCLNDCQGRGPAGVKAEARPVRVARSQFWADPGIS
jgi:hypothetical protein